MAWRKAFLVVAVVAVELGMLSSPAFAALPAPTWLPGQPRIVEGLVVAGWFPVAGAEKYTLYLNGEKLEEGLGIQYFSTAPDKVGTYKYEITTVDANGAESPRSQPGYIDIPPNPPTEKPIFRANPRKRSVVLRWLRPNFVPVFNIYRAESANGPGP